MFKFKKNQIHYIILTIFIICVITITYMYLKPKSPVIDDNLNDTAVTTNISKGEILLFSIKNQMVLPNNMFVGNSNKPYSSNATVYYEAENKLIQYFKNKYEVGDLYVTGLSPEIKCTIELSFKISSDNPRYSIDVMLGNVWVSVQKKDGYTNRIYYYQQDLNYNNLYAYIDVENGNTVGLVNLKIDYNGISKINRLYINSKAIADVPFYEVSSRLTPYDQPCPTYIKFFTYKNRMSANNYIKISIIEMTQFKDRYLVTPIAKTNMMCIGFDKNPEYDRIKNGFKLLNENGFKSTIWFDQGYLQRYYNASEKKVLINETINNGWEVGIHFSRGLSNIPNEDLLDFINNEIDIIDKLGQVKSWCSLQGQDDVNDAILIYNEYSIVSRNIMCMDSNIRNICDSDFLFWDIASEHGFIIPAFTHETDISPAVLYSISYNNFTKLINNLKSLDIQLVPFYYYYSIILNSHNSYFDNIITNKYSCTFTSHTNEGKALVDILYPINSSYYVFDQINGKLNYTKTGDSLQLYVEDNHTYTIAPFYFRLSNGSITLTIDLWNKDGSILTKFNYNSTENSKIQLSINAIKNQQYDIIKNNELIQRVISNNEGELIVEIINDNTKINQVLIIKTTK